MNEDFNNLLGSESTGIPEVDFSNCTQENGFRQTFAQAGITKEAVERLFSLSVSEKVDDKLKICIPVVFKTQDIGPEVKFFTETHMHNVFTLEGAWFIDFHLGMIFVRPSLHKEETGKVIISPETDRGRELHFGQWVSGTAYYNNAIRIDLVGYKGALLACLRDHVSEVAPRLMYYNDQPIGVDSQDWAFVFGFKGGIGSIPYDYKGTTSQLESLRPYLYSKDSGRLFYNTTTNRPLIWNGTKFIDLHDPGDGTVQDLNSKYEQFREVLKKIGASLAKDSFKRPPLVISYENKLIGNKATLLDSTKCSVDVYAVSPSEEVVKFTGHYTSTYNGRSLVHYYGHDFDPMDPSTFNDSNLLKRDTSIVGIDSSVDYKNELLDIPDSNSTIYIAVTSYNDTGFITTSSWTNPMNIMDVIGGEITGWVEHARAAYYPTQHGATPPMKVDIDKTNDPNKGYYKFRYVRVVVSPGETVLINTVGGAASNRTAYLLADEDDNVKEVSPYTICNNLLLTIPEGVKYLFINDDTSSPGERKCWYGLMASINRGASVNKTPGVSTQSNVSETIENIKHSLYGKNKLSLLHYSDIHGDRNSGEAIYNIYNQFKDKISGIINTGDLFNGGTTDAETNNSPDNLWFKYYKENMADITLFTVGNHDCTVDGTAHIKDSNGDSVFNPEFIESSRNSYNRYFKDYVESWGINDMSAYQNEYPCYYSKDFYKEPNKYNMCIRLIVLDAYRETETQVNWFRTQIEDARQKGMRVICASHIPPKKTDKTKDPICTFDSLFKDNDLEGVVNLNSYMQIVDNAMNNSESPLKFICWLGGHKHNDYFYYPIEYPNQLCIIVNKAGDAINNNNDDNREATEDSIYVANLMTFDLVNNVFNIVRIGCNKDRYLRSKKTLCYDYIHKKVIYND